jgi:hypothetical protein
MYYPGLRPGIATGVVLCLFWFGSLCIGVIIKKFNYKKNKIIKKIKL